MKNKISFCLALLLVAMQSMAETPEETLKALTDSAQIKAIYFGELIDGLGKKLTTALGIVKADRIVAVGKEREVPVPSNAKIIDRREHTAATGLFEKFSEIIYSWK